VKFSICVALLAATALPAVAGEASGEFKTSTRKPIHPKYASAFETRDQRDLHKRVVEVVLSDAPIDAAAAAADLDPHMNAINQAALMDHDYILLWVRPENDVSMNATYGEKMVQFVDMTGAGGSLKAEMTTSTPSRVVGRVWSPSPVKTQDETWTVDVRFSTDVAHPPAGTRLPANGGEPGKAFYAMLKSAKERDVMLPQKGPIKVTGGELRGDTAILEVVGEMFPGMKGLFLVAMKKSDGKWVYDRAVRKGLI
jgi:hypothetical protein